MKKKKEVTLVARDKVRVLNPDLDGPTAKLINELRAKGFYSFNLIAEVLVSDVPLDRGARDYLAMMVRMFAMTPGQFKNMMKQMQATSHLKRKEELMEKFKADGEPNPGQKADEQVAAEAGMEVGTLRRDLYSRYKPVTFKIEDGNELVQVKVKTGKK
jgi:hypothetical protein